MKHSQNPVIISLAAEIRMLHEETNTLTKQYLIYCKTIGQEAIQFFFRAMPIAPKLPALLNAMDESMPATTVVNLLTQVKTAYIQYNTILENQNGIMNETIKAHHVTTPPTSPTLGSKRCIDELPPSSNIDQTASSTSAYKKPTSPSESLKHLLALKNNERVIV